MSAILIYIDIDNHCTRNNSWSSNSHNFRTAWLILMWFSANCSSFGGKCRPIENTKMWYSISDPICLIASHNYNFKMLDPRNTYKCHWRILKSWLPQSGHERTKLFNFNIAFSVLFHFYPLSAFRCRTRREWNWRCQRWLRFTEERQMRCHQNIYKTGKSDFGYL